MRWMMKRRWIQKGSTDTLLRTACSTCSALALALTLSVLAVTATQAQTYSVVYRFTGTNGDGSNPLGGVMTDSSGNIYGFTPSGGSGYGTVYRVDTAGNETILHAFNLTDGSGPQGSPVMDSAGNIYGVTGAGGGLGNGTVFKLDTSKNLTVLYNMDAQSRAGLIIDSAGNLYGTSYLGGVNGLGSVFKIDTAGNETTLHSFDDFDPVTPGGILPVTRLTLDAAGNLYGTTQDGGANGYGTVFKLDTNGNNYVQLHDFTSTDGAYPSGSVTLDAAGNIYGTTLDGGVNDVGVVFKIDTTSALTVLHSFAITDGAHPVGDLARDSGGSLYGTAEDNGGTPLGAVQGAVFKLDTAGNLTILHGFTNYPDGAQPSAGVFIDLAGNLYGTTTWGGTLPPGNGTVFKIAAPSQLQDFTAQVAVVRLLHSTGIAGQFLPSNPINPLTDALTLSVAGTNSRSYVITPGSFRSFLGGYAASAVSGSTKLTMILSPLRNGKWSYSAALAGFVPGSTSVTVSLSIGGQSGSATVTAVVY